MKFSLICFSCGFSWFAFLRGSWGFLFVWGYWRFVCVCVCVVVVVVVLVNLNDCPLLFNHIVPTVLPSLVLRNSDSKCQLYFLIPLTGKIKTLYPSL